MWWGEPKRRFGLEARPAIEVNKGLLLSEAIWSLNTGVHLPEEDERMLTLRAEISSAGGGEFQDELETRLEEKYGQNWWVLAQAWDMVERGTLVKA